ncbi:ATP-binding protein [Deinococcus yavapaiensis]|uniref:Tetratricopeptide repeat protein n=1 Tax=Deinococcus yavapaiensis KR-236 TaxID=694435 RepID=A0A318S2T4_9DEIO|nr:tetratricopeptide repeat protein [Deinococcus yavapaiensis]PYE52762.1 tetratricopeptide repeat protein [Deinococcus yavapaiensis KR-236]
MTDTRWTLRVFGQAELVSPSGTVWPLERKLAGVLAYLAVEGAATRARLTELLWPDARPNVARNSLVQHLRKLRLAVGEDLVEGDATLTLRADVTSDAALTRAAFEGDRFDEVHALTERGAVLAHADFDDCPDFAEWLLVTRERQQEWQSRAWRALGARAERQGEFGDALAWEERVLALDPLAEETYGRVMRLHVAMNNRHLALGVYERYREWLRDEMNAEPLRELQALAREIRGGIGGAITAPTFANTPISVLRPPALVGREREWTLMEDAWERGQLILLGGGAGVGKTRLAMEFAASKGAVLKAEARQGDAHVPFATLTRFLRAGLTATPDLALPAWMKRELSRLLPELGGETTAPLKGDEDKLRFFSAAYDLHVKTAAGRQVLVYDDVHFFDEATAEFGAYMLSRAFPMGAEGQPPHIIDVFRSDEVSPTLRAQLQRLVDSGIGVHIELEPLDDEAVEHLITSLDVAHIKPFAPTLARFTGGNPLFLLETVRHLLSGGDLPEEGGVLPPGASDIIARRFSRLSATAQQVARAASVLQSDFTPELVSDVLGAPLVDVLTAWEELEAADVLSDRRFSHDLVYETITRDIPRIVHGALHRRAARTRERLGAPPAQIAHHFLQAGLEEVAAPHFLRAAEAARVTWRMPEAADFYERAADLFERAGRRPEAFAARFTLAHDVLKEFDLGARFEVVAQRLLDEARTPGERGRAWAVQGILRHRRGDAAGTEQAAREGLAELDVATEPEVVADLTNLLGVALVRQGRWNEAVPVLEGAVEQYRALGVRDSELATQQNIAAALFQLGQYTRTVDLCLDVASAAEARGLKLLQAAALGSAAAALGHQGRKRAGLELAEQALALLRGVQGAMQHEVSLLLTLGACARDCGEYSRALDALERARTLSAGYSNVLSGMTLRHLASVHDLLGDGREARTLLEEALALQGLPGETRASILTLLAEVLHSQGEAVDAVLAAALPLLAAQRSKSALRGRLALAVTLPPEEALQITEEVVEELRGREDRDLLLVALVRHARALLRAKRPAIEAAVEAARLLKTFEPLECSVADVLFTVASVREAVGDADAQHARLEAERWLEETASRHVPAARRATFVVATRRRGDRSTRVSAR